MSERGWIVKKIVTKTYTYSEIKAEDADRAILAWTKGDSEMVGSEWNEEVVAVSVDGPEGDKDA
jgi:hypothetical protein